MKEILHSYAKKPVSALITFKDSKSLFSWLLDHPMVKVYKTDDGMTILWLRGYTGDLIPGIGIYIGSD